MLGGVEFPAATRGPVGVSDADVLTHAIIDALLGAAGLGDIGQHFPDRDPAYVDADSMVLLRRVVALLEAAGCRPLNVDATIIAEEPQIAPQRQTIAANLARGAEDAGGSG